MDLRQVHRKLRYAYFAGDLPLPAEFLDLLDSTEWTRAVFTRAWDMLAEAATKDAPQNRVEFWRGMERAAELLDWPEKAKLAHDEVAKPWKCRICESQLGSGVCSGCACAVLGALAEKSFSDPRPMKLIEGALKYRDVIELAKQLLDHPGFEPES